MHHSHNINSYSQPSTNNKIIKGLMLDGVFVFSGVKDAIIKMILAKECVL
ncbi:hypothetical protein MIDIC_170037 [Alphaproteobacteria bacterium]